jgi:hypothetical protein
LRRREEGRGSKEGRDKKAVCVQARRKAVLRPLAGQELFAVVCV